MIPMQAIPASLAMPRASHDSEDCRSEESSSHRVHRVILIPAGLSGSPIGPSGDSCLGWFWVCLCQKCREEIKEQDSRIHSIYIR